MRADERRGGAPQTQLVEQPIRAAEVVGAVARDGSRHGVAARRHLGSTRKHASSPPPTATRRCASSDLTGAALDAPAAEAELLREARDGKLDAQAVDAVLAAAGHRVPSSPRMLPAGLTERELEVLLALVSGQSNQWIGESLGISVKTVDHHIQHIYAKAGARSRAAATVWAFEHALVNFQHIAASRPTSLSNVPEQHPPFAATDGRRPA